MKRLFCFGLGFCATALAAELLGEGWRVAGTVRGEDKARRLRRQGIEAVVFDGGAATEALVAALAGSTHLLDSIPPPAPDGKESAGPRAAPLEAVAPPLALLTGEIVRLERLQWAGYLSTTGVYGDRGGGWVDEATPPAPTLERARRRLAAEQAWLLLHERYALPVHLFRLAAIYGPGRGVLEQLRSGRARRIVKAGQLFSRIHVRDIVATLRASMARPHAGAIYNLCDDAPAAPDRVVCHAAALLGLPPPPAEAFEEAELSEMARSFYRDNKRVANRRIKEELGVRLRYPSWREGLAAEAAALRSGREGAPAAEDAHSSSRASPSRSRSRGRERR